jgi:phosphatidylglycerol:prolipoprotein diacylglycerol transferase
MFRDFTLLGFRIGVFSLLLVAGFWLGSAIFFRLVRLRVDVPVWKLRAMVIVMASLMIVGALMMFHVLYAVPVTSFERFFASGSTVMGAVIAFILIAPFMSKWFNLQMSWRTYTDLATLSFVPAQMLGKIGCYAAGCCWGRECPAEFGAVFPIDLNVPAPGGVPLWPIQVYEAGALAIVGIVCWIVYRRNVPAGVVTGVALIGRGIERFLAEFLRGDAVMSSLGLTNAQIASVLFILVGIGFILLRDQRELTLANGSVRRYRALEVEPQV